MKNYKTREEAEKAILKRFGKSSVFRPVWITNHHFPAMQTGFYVSSTIAGKVRVYDKTNDKMVTI